MIAVVAPILLGATPAPIRQGDLDTLAATMGYRVAILNNHAQDCPGGATQCFVSTITLTMPANLPPALQTGGFDISYNYVRPLIAAQSPAFEDTFVNGDLHRLTIKPGMRLRPGMAYTVTLWGEGTMFSTYDVMPNAFVSAPGLAARTIRAAKAHVDPETGIESLPFVGPMTDEAKLATARADEQTKWLTPERAFAVNADRGTPDANPRFAIIPKPLHVAGAAGAAIDLTHGVTLRMTGVTRRDIAPALAFLAETGTPIGGRGPTLSIELSADNAIAPEGYRLRADESGIAIEARDAAGAAYAVRSLAQEAAHEYGHLLPLTIEDAPAYRYRGLHLDLARNFHSKAEILKLIEAMATYKLNRLHLHLADDEGWRLAIRALPELTEIGSRRCDDRREQTCIQPQLGAGPTGKGSQNGFLTDADYIEILKAAAARQIEVIPSIDMPGHSRAAIRSMEVRYRRLMAMGRPEEAKAYRLVEPGDTTRYRSIQYYHDNTLNVCLPQTFRFVGTVIDAVAALHHEAGVPLHIFHIGGDETAGAWTGSPACKALMARDGLDAEGLSAYFIERVSRMVADRGLEVAGWSDGLGRTDPAKMPKHVQTDIWGGLFSGAVGETHKAANQGWDTVLSIPDVLYLDMPYAPDPNERGYDWASRGIDTFKVFSFMPGNLAANAAVMTDPARRALPIADSVPLKPGARIEGLQAQLWSETVRGDAAVDYMLFPRLLAVAERAWRTPDWQPAYQPGAGFRPDDPRVDRARLMAAWRDFAGRVGAQFTTLDRMGIAYRLPPPGARIERGMLRANLPFPGLAIEQRAAEGGWTRYHGPVSMAGPVSVRAVAPDGRPGRSVTVRPASN
jgi:hexosaminidase